MKINNAKFIISAVGPQQYPGELLPELAFIGRSNVGKSSFINTIINRKNLARTSNNPGKTQTINFYLIENSFHLVDLPGYGFARVSKTMREKWGKFIEEYLSKRSQLQCVFHLIDIRHVPTNDDVLMFQWLQHLGIPTVIIATKLDKIPRGKRQQHVAQIKKALNIKEGLIIPFSSVSKEGKEDVLELIDEILEQPKETGQ